MQQRLQCHASTTPPSCFRMRVRVLSALHEVCGNGWCQTVGTRGLQSTTRMHAKGKGKKDAAKKRVKQPGQLSFQVCTGLNIYKEGNDPSLHHPDEYPQWLWELSKPRVPLSKLEAHALSHGLHNLDHETLHRLYDLTNRRKIRRQNTIAGSRST